MRRSPRPIELVEAELERTLRWADRCLRAHTKPDQALFGIVQGGVDPDLRAKSAAQTAALGFPGFGIGGLSVGESRAERRLALDASFAELPEGKPRYVMGLGDTEGLLEAIGRGADMFDCVLPTRLARHGKVLTRTGDFSLRNAVSEADDRPIDEECSCHTCRTHSRAYLRHLVRVKELSAHRLLTIHNLRYTLDLVAAARVAIELGTFSDFVGGGRRDPLERFAVDPWRCLISGRSVSRDLEDPVTHLVFAQETAASPLPSLLFLGLMVAVFWLFIIRPQRQRQSPAGAVEDPQPRRGGSDHRRDPWHRGVCRRRERGSSGRGGKDPVSRKAVGSQVGPDKPEAESS